MSDNLKRLREALAEQGDDVVVLYAAAANYVENRGGKVVAIGGVQVQEWPEDKELIYRVALKITGRKPEFAALQEDA